MERECNLYRRGKLMATGTIVKGIGGFYYISTSDGVYECRARGRFRKDKITPLVGDFAEISILDEKNKKGSLDNIFERRNLLIRPRVSNVDQAVIVFAAKSPDMNVDLLDKFIILVEEQNLDVVICINKIDLDVEENYKSVQSIYENAGYKVVPISAEKSINMDLLQETLMDKISVFAGPSGVGKSSLLNTISPELKLNTGVLSTKIDRGKHTTRHAELMKIFHNTFIVDSPGFTSLFLTHIKPEELKQYFREFEGYTCRFNGCNHVNEPDCGVKEAVGKTIASVRYERYVTIFNELNNS